MFHFLPIDFTYVSDINGVYSIIDQFIVYNSQNACLNTLCTVNDVDCNISDHLLYVCIFIFLLILCIIVTLDILYQSLSNLHQMNQCYRRILDLSLQGIVLPDDQVLVEIVSLFITYTCDCEFAR